MNLPHVDYIVGDVDSLESLRPVDIGGATVVYARGYRVHGDGGEGVFEWRAKVELDDRGTRIRPKVGGGHWSRVRGDEAYPEWFGARGNDLVDDRPALQAACDALASTGGVVRLRSRTYFLFTTLKVPEGVGIEGTGRHHTRLVVQPAAAFAADQTPVLPTAIEWVPKDASLRLPPSEYAQGGFLQNLTVSTFGDSAGGRVAYKEVRNLVALRAWSGFVMRDVILEGCAGEGLIVDTSIDCQFERVTILRAGIAGALVGGAADDAVSTTIRFNGCHFSQTRNGPGASVGGLGLSFNDCVFESNGAEADGPLDADRGHGLVVRWGHATVQAPFFEGNAGYDLWAGADAPIDGNAMTATYVAVVHPMVNSFDTESPLTKARKQRPRLFLDNVSAGFVHGGRIKERPALKAGVYIDVRGGNFMHEV